jgi:tRNA 2-selenouridine synthase
MMDIAVRLPRLLKEYSAFPKTELKASVEHIAKRLGSDNVNEAIKAIENDDFAKAIEITLTYYDKAYLFGLSRKVSENIIYVKTETDDIKENATKILEVADEIKWEI